MKILKVLIFNTGYPILKLLILVIISFTGCFNNDQPQKTTRCDSIKISISASDTSLLNEQSYNAVRQNIEIKRAELNREFNQADSDSAKKTILNLTKQLIISAICDSLTPYWYGTPWEFYGQTEIPQNGSVACGYFVSTLLKHAGFRVERVRMAELWRNDGRW